MVQTKLFPEVQNLLQALATQFDQIAEERKAKLEVLSTYVREQKQSGQPVKLNFICTHNSRRSHLSQIWAQIAAYYYGVEEVSTFSGGTEATAFNYRAVAAVTGCGIKVIKTEDGENPIYKLYFAQDAPLMEAWSKTYDDPANPKEDFAAVMTCTDADQNCPVIIGAHRISLPFVDPKEFDDTDKEREGYQERAKQIAREILYAFSRV